MNSLRCNHNRMFLVVFFALAFPIGCRIEFRRTLSQYVVPGFELYSLCVLICHFNRDLILNVIRNVNESENPK